MTKKLQYSIDIYVCMYILFIYIYTQLKLIMRFQFWSLDLGIHKKWPFGASCKWWLGSQGMMQTDSVTKCYLVTLGFTPFKETKIDGKKDHRQKGQATTFY